MAQRRQSSPRVSNPRRDDRKAAPLLPGGEFGFLVGTFERAAEGSRYRNVADDNHIYLWLRVAAGPWRGSYECAVTLGSPSTDGLLVPIYQSTRLEVITGADVPREGFLDGHCSYAEFGVRDEDFLPAQSDALASEIVRRARASFLVGAYGVAYRNGGGLHDIHLNSHETPESLHRDRLDPEGRPTRDGALVFFQNDSSGSHHVDWLLLKFRTQKLNSDPLPAAENI